MGCGLRDTYWLAGRLVGTGKAMDEWDTMWDTMGNRHDRRKGARSCETPSFDFRLLALRFVGKLALVSLKKKESCILNSFFCKLKLLLVF